MTRSIGAPLAGLLWLVAMLWTDALAAAPQQPLNRAFALAGIVLDHGHRVQPDTTTVNVRVVSEVIPDEHAGKAYDVILLILASSLKEGHIVTLTSGSTASCRASLKSLLVDRLTGKVINPVYQGSRLTRVEENAAVRQLASQWRTRGWLRNCAERAEEDHDVFEVLILNDVGN